MAAWKAVAGDGLLYLTLLLGLLRSDINPYIAEYPTYPEVQEAILGPNLGLHIIDTHRDLYSPSKHFLDDNEVIGQEINRLIHSSSNFPTYNQEISTWHVLDSSGNIQNETASQTYISPASASNSLHTDISLNPEDRDLIQILIQTDEETLSKETPLFRPALLARPHSISTVWQSVQASDASASLQINLAAHSEHTSSNTLVDLDDLDDSLPSWSPNGAGALSDISLSNALLHDRSLGAGSSAFLRTNSSGDLMGFPSDVVLAEVSPRKGMLNLSLPSLHAVDDLLDDSLDQIDLDLGVDLDTNLPGELMMDDWRRESLSDDSAVSMGGSTSIRDWSDSASDSHEAGAIGGCEYPVFSLIGKREPRSPDLRASRGSRYSAETWSDDLSDEPLTMDVDHDHTYAAPFGGQPHVRKMDIKVEREPSRGEAHDEILVRKARIPFNVETIINVPVDRFNQLLKKHKLSSKQAELVRDIRRRGKNKVAAQNCRQKKMVELTDLELEIRALQYQRDSLKASNTNLNFQSDQLRKNIDSITADLFTRIRDPVGNFYDPNRYSIEVDESGSVEVIAPESRTSQSRSSKRSRKRRRR